MWRRDPTDRRYPERLAGSTLASLVIHALLAILLFSLVANSALEGATESVSGATLVTIERQVPVVAQAPAVTHEAAPMPHAPRIAPVRHAPVAEPPRQKQPPQKPELSHIVPSAPPQASPLPQASIVPTALPTEKPLFEKLPQPALPAVPTSMPSVATVAVTVTIPPTAAPSPAPTSVPAAHPSPHPPAPTAAPTRRPASPAPVATAEPRATAAPLMRASASPAPKPGVPSPSPTRGPALAKSAGAAPSPGPKGHASPGPRAGNAARAKPGNSHPVNVRPTPVPAHPPGGGGGDLNARLRALLPHNAVVPSEKSYHEAIGLGSLNPTPPPEVLAATKFTFEERGTGGDARVKMWVTNVRHDGPFTICEGWLLRFPRSTQPPTVQGTFTHPLAGGISISVGGNPGGVGPPIVESHASTTCSARALVPFNPHAP